MDKMSDSVQESCTTTGSDYVLGLETRIRVQDEMLKEMSRKILELEKLKEFVSEDNPEKGILKTICTDVEDFVSSNSRAARFDAENQAMKTRMVELVDQIDKLQESRGDGITVEKVRRFGHEVLNLFGLSSPEKTIQASGLLMFPQSGSGDRCVTLEQETIKHLTSENGQLQVRLELEHERRLRVQDALAETEKKYCSLKWDLEAKQKQLDDLIDAANIDRSKLDRKVSLMAGVNKRLKHSIEEKEEQIRESESKAKLLSLKAEEFENMFNNQLETLKSVQSELTTASSENQTLVKEMETLSNLFNLMEQHYVRQALNDYKGMTSEDSENAAEDALKADDIASKSIGDSLQESCFKEVTTKNGTRLVLSVSKTYMKLKDLILEKKSLEDRVEKMKAINNNLVSRVNLHEAKLFNITDELNKTWTLVSTLKLQHKQLHTSEQILRAELAEKRELLAKLREELELSRESWTIVKTKTADSERQWRALRDEFAERRRCVPPTTSPESGFSDVQTEEEEGDDNVSNSSASQNEINEEFFIQTVNEPLNIHKENEMTESTHTLRCDDEENSLTEDVSESNFQMFIPSMDYVASVPPDLMPPLLPQRDPFARLDVDNTGRETSGLVDDNYEELYQKLIASTARSAALASRLAEIHKSITTAVRDNTGVVRGDGDDDDFEPRTEDDDDPESSELQSEPEVLNSLENQVPADLDGTDFQSHDLDLESNSDSSDLELEDLGLTADDIERALSGIHDGRFSEDSDDENDDEDSDTASAASVRFANGENSAGVGSDVDEVASVDEPVHVEGTILTAPSDDHVLQTQSQATPGRVRTENHYPGVSRPGFANQDSVDETEDDSNSTDAEDSTENATAVTRFLIKTLPKQLSSLRNEKAILEDRVQDLEARISEQNTVFAELERRSEIYKREAETARKWTASIQSVKTHENCACSTKEDSKKLALAEDERFLLINRVEAEETCGQVCWTVNCPIKDLNVSITSSTKNENTSVEDFTIEDLQDSFRVLVNTKQCQAAYTLTICSKNELIRLKLVNVSVNVST